MATDKQVAAEREKVAKLREELAELNAAEADPATENAVTLTLLQEEEAELKRQIELRKAQAKSQHELAKDPLAYSKWLLEQKNKKADERTLLVAEEAAKLTGTKAPAAADENKSGGN